MSWSLMLLSCLVVANVSRLEGGRPKAINYDALERAWESGDEEHELRTEGDEHYRQLAHKSEEEAKALGPQMVFVTLKDGRESLPDVALRWKEMLWNGGVRVDIYEVADLKLLVGLQKGIFINDMMKFLSEQRNVKEYEWNGKVYATHGSRKFKHKPRQKQARRGSGKKTTRPKRELDASSKHSRRKHVHTDITTRKREPHGEL